VTLDSTELNGGCGAEGVPVADDSEDASESDTCVVSEDVRFGGWGRVIMEGLRSLVLTYGEVERNDVTFGTVLY
jgi:hypothetical protein